ncbi:hypothetical protein RIR_jg42017.t1 [Rhizophagus irregularis DAOM 181602=DAOM 197198]|nr:hypothetical protein RIR_jg42017.t1 [Rhizophagus irregularis DAOM 181602=DAOM 197198]
MLLHCRSKGCAPAIRHHSHSASPNIKDINLAPLTRNLSAKAVNMLLSLNSYKPKRWAYSSPDNTNKLCHRCGKLGCAPNFCPLKQTRGRSRTRDPVAKLKLRFNVNQPHRSNSKTANARSCSRSRSKSKDRSAPNSGRDNNISHDRTNNDKNHNKSAPNISQHARYNSKERSVSFSSSSHSTARPLP